MESVERSDHVRGNSDSGEKLEVVMSANRNVKMPFAGMEVVQWVNEVDERPRTRFEARALELIKLGSDVTWNVRETTLTFN